MSSRLILGACVSVALMGVSLRGQDGKMAMEHSYTGCLERASSGSYTLSHVMAAADAMKKSMNHDTMDHDTMNHDTMNHDTMMKDSMAPRTLELSSTTVNLSRHVGHKVSINGTEGDPMGGVPTLSVKSLKMVGKSCS